MTDTPRTLAEVQALLADNNAQAISAQDIRDMVMSIADPVANGGLEIGGPMEEQSFAAFRISNVGQHLSGGIDILTPALDISTNFPAQASESPRYFGNFPMVPRAGDQPPTDAGIWDPQGWLVSAPYENAQEAYWSQPTAVDSAILLPRGLYYVWMFCATQGTLGPNTVVFPLFDYADPYWLYDEFTDIYWVQLNAVQVLASAQYDGVGWGSPQFYSSYHVSVSTPIHFVPYVLVAENPNPLTLRVFGCQIQKIR